MTVFEDYRPDSGGDMGRQTGVLGRKLQIFVKLKKDH